MQTSNKPFDTITIPSTAGPGQARVVITSRLPPPLDTFTWGGGSRTYTGGIIYYGLGDDTSYVYECTVRNALTPTQRQVHMGSVRSGAVIVDASGNPKIQSWQYDITSGSQSHVFSPDLFQVAVPGAGGTFNNFNISSGSVSLTAGAPGATLTLAATNILLNSPTFYGNFIGPYIATDVGPRTATGTTYTSLSAKVGVAFTAPPGGNVLVTFGSVIHTSAAAGNARLAIQVRTGATVGAGSIVYAATDFDALMVTGTSDFGLGNAVPITGLVGGNDYNVELLGASSGTGTYAQNKVTVSAGF